MQPTKQLYDGRIQTTIENEAEIQRVLTAFKSKTKSAIDFHLRFWMVSEQLVGSRFAIDFKCINEPDGLEMYEKLTDNAPELAKHIDEVLEACGYDHSIISYIILLESGLTQTLKYNNGWNITKPHK
ncbi:MAG: hypothetical protein ACRCXZ_07025 [Patescibacteria group bacterium]